GFLLRKFRVPNVGCFMLKEITTKPLLYEGVNLLKKQFNSSKVFKPKNISKFVFLCGANQSLSEISERRKALIEFSNRNLSYTQFFLAEKVFATLQSEEHKGNILDVEHLISDFSDHIIIILESPSSFSELGAFSNNELRKKLIIINDIKFKDQQSFINLGPIKAIEEAIGKSRVIYYQMSPNGVYQRDAIGDTFYSLYELLKEPLKAKISSINISSCDPSKHFDKNVAMFLHDLVYISGPILHKELIEILKIIFGKEKFNKITHLLAILTAFESIERNKLGLYRSKLKTTYYEYRFDIDNIIAIFRNYTLKNYPDRIYEY
ncbi:retron St85 family effector protein, partial [Dickeya dianthicola]|uniref:retron St85 family effector protein n=1 Tax=Dickeya dianthicola TaxID=204039 RepID=UPI001F611B95